MRNSYIANSHEAAALNSGKQTAVLVKMKVQPTPNKFNTEKVDFEFRNSKQYRAGRNFDVQNLNDQFFGILDFAPYQLGQEVYVREKWAEYKNLYDCMRGCDRVCICNKEYVYNSENLSTDEHSALQSPATMPKSAARTRFKVVGVEAVTLIGILANSHYLSKVTCGVTAADSVWILHKLIMSKIGRQAWDENHYVWFFKIEKC